VHAQAIFSTTPEEFIEQVEGWVLPQLSTGVQMPMDPLLADHCFTLRHMHEVLLLESEYQ
jgi:hypothetical protein